MAGTLGAAKKLGSKKTRLGTLPKNWCTTLPERVSKLPFTNFYNALDAACEILLGRSDAELQRIAQNLRQIIAKHPPRLSPEKDIDYKGFVFDPRAIYSLHAKADNGLDFVALRDHLAVAIVMELTRACDAFSDAHDQPSWVKAAQVVANARALSEWIYMVDALLAGGQTAKSAFPHNIRALVKAKIKKAKSEAAKKGSRKAHKSDKQLVIDHYEQHKSEFKSLAQAAGEIKEAKLVLMEYSTIYKWLLKYVKKQQG